MKEKILSKKARIAVIGLGYVGLPLAISFAKKGFHVYGIDTNSVRIERLRKGQSYITDIASADVSSLVRSLRLNVSTDFKDLSYADAVIICVPTPIKRKYTPDISYMVSAVRSVSEHLRKGMLVILESTTYPGTTQELIQPELEKKGLKVGKDFYLAFSPERIDPGNKNYDVTRIPKVVGGITKTCTALTQLLYQQIIKQVHPVSSAKTAEMVKLLENSFRIVNIGWINEIAQACHTMGIDVWEVIEAAKTKPFGFMPFYPGLGVGGHCIPEDPLYLYWKAKKYGFNSKFIKLSADTNSNMPAYVIHRIQKSLRKALSASKVLVVGVTYKKDVKDLRKSPAIKFIELLKEKAKVDYYDPLVPFLKVEGVDMRSIALDAGAVRKYDCIVIAVDHSRVDYDLILKNAKKIFDARNIYKRIASQKIERL